MGKAGVGLSDVYGMRWNEFYWFMTGMIEREYDAKAYLLRDIAFQQIVGNVHIKQDAKPVRATDLIVFPLEEVNTVDVEKIKVDELRKAFKM